MKTNLSILALTFLAFAASALAPLLTKEDKLPEASLSVGHGDVATLRAAFDGWRKYYENHGGSPEVFKLSLGYSKALSDRFTQAHGRMEFNLLDGGLSFKVAGLGDGAYDLWFVDDRDEPGNTAKPEPTDGLLRVGGFKVKNGKGFLATKFTREQLAGFTLDTVVLTISGKSPVESVVIAGSPDLMSKLYYADQPWAVAKFGDFGNPSAKTRAPFGFLLPKVALADTLSDLTPVLGAQVALGRQIFHNETFGGNGRNCGTCHRADNNFTIDPIYIAKLPANDPLFVAETNPALAGLENPTLMRKYGLILTSVDGPGFDVFRSVPHTLSLATSVVSEKSNNPPAPFRKGDFPADDAFANATGWSGDGAPGSGSLREFTLGAVIEHMPKTLNRMAGTDFRLPTNQELDAIQAYLLSLGRSKDYPVWKLTFTDPLTEAGKLLFDTKENPCTHNTAQTGNPASCPPGESVVLGETANCNGCHQHAGARSSTTFANPTRNTGIENLKINPARLSKPDMAYDGGFGVGASTCGPTISDTCYGDGRFNTPSLIEAADTSPFYHNNSVSTLEEAVAAYNSDAFNHSPGAVTTKLANRHVKLDSTQVMAVASFLRAINALENIRLSNRLDNQARQIANNASAKELAKLGLEENQDAIRVLKEGVLGAFNQAVAKLEQASNYEILAQMAPVQAMRNTLLRQAITRKQEARSLIATCDQNAAIPATVGASPDGFVYTCAELSAY